MNKVLYAICVLLVVACAAKHKENVLLALVDNRAHADTTLVFQGITIGAPYDSAKVEAMMSAMPMTLVYNNQKYAFKRFSAEATRSGVCTDKYEVVGVDTDYLSDFDFFGLVRLYMESYGEPSYFTLGTKHLTTIGTYHIGTLDEVSQKPFQAQDAINMIMEDHDDSHEFLFVWEWKNQSIYLRHTRKLSIASFTTITYWNTGADARKAEEAKKKSEEAAKKAEEQKFLDDTKASQQI